MLTWPHPDTDWAEQLADTEAVFTRIAVEIAKRQSVLVVCNSPADVRSVRQRLVDAGAPSRQLHFAIAGSNDSWARDHGPLTLVDDQGRMRLLDFRFNGWGGKFPAGHDDQISSVLNDQRVFDGAEFVSLDWVLEGGAIESDGRGGLLATAHSVLGDGRNPGVSRSDLESMLRTSLKIERLLWLEHGVLSGDDTDGHIDTLVRFSDPDTLLYITAAPDDPDYPELEAMRDELERLRTPGGEPYRLIPLPDAGGTCDTDGRRLPASYANFLIINGAVLVPTYRHANDGLALRIIADAFPDRAVVDIDCLPIVRQNGSLHCLTMQFPAGLQLGTLAP